MDYEIMCIDKTEAFLKFDLHGLNFQRK